MPDDPSAPSDPASDAHPPLSRAVLRAFLSRLDTIRWVNAHVKDSVPGQMVEQVAQDALLEAWENAWVPSDEAALKSWLRTITDRVVADFTGKEVSQKRFKGKMPTAPVRTDEAGLPVEDLYDDAIVDIDASHDPTADTLHKQGWLLRRFIDEQTAGNRRERRTFDMMMAHYEDERSWEDIAEERKLSVNAVALRVHRFEKKYAERYQKYRDRMIPMLWLGGILGGAAAVGVVALVVWALFFRAPKVESILPGPPLQWPTPSASAEDPSKDIAAPPSPPPLQTFVPGPPGPKAPPRLKP
jgi:DNA-directed RNA polymerase specialized sigma24 family protein